MRVENWQKAFWSIINACSNKPFEWGKFDCCTLAIDCIVAIRNDETFRDFVQENLGQWRTAKQALRIHAKGLHESASLILGEKVKVSFLFMGDIGLFMDDRGREVICVHDGAGFICPNKIGLRKVPYKLIKFGWRI